MLEERIEEMEAILKERAKVTDEAKWLMSIPGIGYHNALLIQSELGEIERFSNPKSMVSYSGLAPKVEQSGDYTRYGHINKHSNGFLREHSFRVRGQQSVLLNQIASRGYTTK